MFENTHRRPFSAADAVTFAVVVTVVAICFAKPPSQSLECDGEKTSPQSLECNDKKPPLYSCVRGRTNFVVERGVRSLRGRPPGQFIRGMIDTENADLGLIDFEKAALELAPQKNPGAEFILGWLCADGSWHAPSTAAMVDLSSQQIDYSKLGLTLNQRLAAQWYVLASLHGSSEASVALGNMLDFSHGGDHEKSLALAANFYKRGIEQGDVEARTHLACSYAYGRGVTADGARAWRELEAVIKNGDTENSTYAIVLAMEAWKDGKITPPKDYSQGAVSAYDFAKRYQTTFSGANLDEIYTNPGCVPDAYPQYRWDLATAIRRDWLNNDRSNPQAERE